MKRCTLLYVEDHAESIALVETLLAGRKDLRLLRAMDVKLAIKLARAEPPDAILIDINLAGTSGPEFMKALRADPATESTPVLALGAAVKPATIVRALEAGFFQYLTKPLQAGAFMEALDFALEFAAVERSEQNPIKESR